MRPVSLVLAALLTTAAVVGSVLAERAGDAVAQEKAPPIQVRDVTYMDGETKLVGHLSIPAGASKASPRPAVLVVHEWWGRGKHADHSADELARLGYVALAVDMYGDARTTTDAKEAGAWAGAVRKNPDVEKARIEAALDLVRSLPEVDGTRLACIGYCFGGTVSLDAAWFGEDLRAVVSFHGSLTLPKPEQAKGVKPSLLICHGADDPFVAKEVVDEFQASLRENGYDWQFVSYGGAVHSFTNPAADGSFNPGAKYDEKAAKRSWTLMRSFLDERLK